VKARWILALPFAGCGVAVVDAPPVCLTWSEEGPVAISDVPSGLACEVAASVAESDLWDVLSGGEDPPIVPPGEHELRYVCTHLPAEAACPHVPEAEAQLSPCLEGNEGSCDFGGWCRSTFIWSMCGPDPSASGGCCYYAYVVTAEWLSAIGSE